MSNQTKASGAAPPFARLDNCTKAEAALRNSLVRFAGPGRDWQEWAADAFGGLARRRSGYRVRLRAVHLLPDRNHEIECVADGVARIGRKEGNDLLLPDFTVGSLHATVTAIPGGRCRVDFLRADDGPSRILANGAEFGILPWRIRVWSEPVFDEGNVAGIAAGALSTADWKSFHDLPGFIDVPVEIHPCGKVAYLSVEESLVSCIAGRMSADGVEPAAWAGAAGNRAARGVAAYMLLRLLERANRELRFPFRLVFPEETAAPAGPERGLMIRFTVHTGDLFGAVRLFIPFDLIEAVEWRGRMEDDAMPAITWPLQAVLATTGLASATVEEIVVGALLRVQANPALYLDNAFTEGWRTTVRTPNPLTFCVQDYFNRRIDMDREPNGVLPEMLRLDRLPVRLHAVLCEKEMSFADIRDLKPGTLVELNSREDGPVTVFLNGKRAGTGKLVKIDGELALEILDWRVI
jgi:flagellar motor switch/type III secretory pathway protein FliN